MAIARLTVGRVGGAAARLAGDLMQFLLPRVCSACRRLMDEGSGE